MLCRAMKSLAKALELSSCAAALVGPKIANPSARNASTTPLASGASGPTTVRSMALVLANCTSAALSTCVMLAVFGSFAVPALPGATNTALTLFDCASFHAKACSRPPDPMTNTFIAFILNFCKNKRYFTGLSGVGLKYLVQLRVFALRIFRLMAN